MIESMILREKIQVSFKRLVLVFLYSFNVDLGLLDELMELKEGVNTFFACESNDVDKLGPYA